MKTEQRCWNLDIFVCVWGQLVVDIEWKIRKETFIAEKDLPYIVAQKRVICTGGWPTVLLVGNRLLFICVCGMFANEDEQRSVIYFYFIFLSRRVIVLEVNRRMKAMKREQALSLTPVQDW